MKRRCAILNDYQHAAMRMADWSPLRDDVEITVFDRHLGDIEANAAALQAFEIVCVMRERTPFPRALFARLPKLRLLVTSAPRNPSIDLKAARDHGVTVCGTEVFDHPTAELSFALILGLCRHVGVEDRAIRTNGPWQSTVGIDLKGKTIGIIGLGRLGRQMTVISRAFGMHVLAWSQNLTEDRCREVGAELTTKDDLLRRSDIVGLYVNWSARTTGLIGRRELALMKPTALLINCARGPIVEETALIEALTQGRIAGAGLDVYDVEPLPADHPIRALPNTLLTPHVGYVTEDNYRTFFGHMVEDIRAWLDGTPVRVLDPLGQIDRSQ